jgi:hypothetical protein
MRYYATLCSSWGASPVGHQITADPGGIDPIVRSGSNRVSLSACRLLPVCPDQRTSSDQPGWSVSCQLRTHAPQKSAAIRSPRGHWNYSGNPALRKPSIISFALIDSWLRAIHANIVKAGSNSSTPAAASRASASRPRWAKADARQRYGPG